MNNKIYKRVKTEAKYIIKEKCTVRELAKIMKVSKSTVHKDLQDRLKEIDMEMYKKVDEILKYHLEIRHIKGGEATRQKYLNRKG